MFIKNILIGTLLSFISTVSLAHSGHFTHEENDWLNRQHSRSGVKCCDMHDVHIGQNVEWRINNQGQYEVKVNEQWYVIQEGTIMRRNPNDPSPFGNQALLFYSPNMSGGIFIWCFSPEPLM